LPPLNVALENALTEQKLFILADLTGTFIICETESLFDA
jgi:hypothetical protein